MSWTSPYLHRVHHASRCRQYFDLATSTSSLGLMLIVACASSIYVNRDHPLLVPLTAKLVELKLGSMQPGAEGGSTPVVALFRATECASALEFLHHLATLQANGVVSARLLVIGRDSGHVKSLLEREQILLRIQLVDDRTARALLRKYRIRRLPAMLQSKAAGRWERVGLSAFGVRVD